MSEATLSKILYNSASEAAPAEDNTYESALAKTQAYLSEHHAQTLAETVLQEQARDTVRYLTEQFLTSNKVYVAGMSIRELTNRLYRDMAGYSILEEPLADPSVEEILVNAYNDVEIIDEKGRHKYHESFATPEQGRDIARRLVRISGQTIDTAHPIVDAYITTGVRITAFFPPVIDEKDGIAFTIRKQHLFNVTRDQLIRWGTANDELLDFISLCLNHGVSVSVAGKTGSGKTTLTSYLLNNLDEKLRIVTIEETREILIVNPLDENNQKLKSVVTLCTRPSDDPRLDVNMQSLVRSTLRMRPDIITMAEMRGGEAYDAQEAARTGHTVTSTLHANSAKQTYSRILTMCQMNPGNTLTPTLLMDLIVEAFPITIFCKQLSDNKRCITEVVEATSACDGVAKTRTLFQYEKTRSGDSWRRVGAISPRIAELMLSNGADEKQVSYFSREPTPTTKSRSKGGTST